DASRSFGQLSLIGTPARKGSEINLKSSTVHNSSDSSIVLGSIQYKIITKNNSSPGYPDLLKFINKAGNFFCINGAIKRPETKSSIICMCICIAIIDSSR